MSSYPSVFLGLVLILYSSTPVGFASEALPSAPPTSGGLTTSPSGLSTGGSSAHAYEPVPGSKVLLQKAGLMKEPAVSFLVGRVLDLEKALASYETLAPEVRAQRDLEVQRVMSNTMNLERLGQRALIAYWEDLGSQSGGAKKQADYLALFRKLVEENYLERLREYMNGRYRIPLTGFRTGPQGVLIVDAKIERPDVDLLVEFRLMGEGEEMRIVDIRLDETSLEATYRGSFNRVIRRKGGLAEGFPELMRVMQIRLDELQSGEATRL